MRLVAEKLSARDKSDRLLFVRGDGSSTECQLPRQGTLPHDLIHYVVESTLPLKYGFLSLVAAGADAAFVMKKVHDKSDPNVEIEAVQTEALVEALQTQLWASHFDESTFLEAASLAASSRGKAPFNFGGFSPIELYKRALELHGKWSALPYYAKMELYFKAGEG